jgi:G3E family GTPase
MSSTDLIPISLLTGFLGSGKTTLLNQLVRQPELHDTLIIINEFGEISLDHLLVTHTRDDIVVELDGGCLCCTVRGDLQQTLREVHNRIGVDGKRQFSRILIETTGLADPTPILHTFMADRFVSEHYRIDAILTTVDSVNGMTSLDQHSEALKQAAVADRLLLTKADLADRIVLSALRARLAAINPGAAQIMVKNGQANAGDLLGLDLFNLAAKSADVTGWLNDEAYRNPPPSAAEANPLAGISRGPMNAMGSAGQRARGEAQRREPIDPNRHDDRIKAFCFTFDTPIDPQAFDTWITFLLDLLGTDMLRIKGIVNLAGRNTPTVIHCVQHLFHPVVELPEWPSDDRRTRIVFITRDIGRNTIDYTFKTCLRMVPDASHGPLQSTHEEAETDPA